MMQILVSPQKILLQVFSNSPYCWILFEMRDHNLHVSIDWIYQFRCSQKERWL